MTLAARIEYPSSLERRTRVRLKLLLQSTSFGAGDEVVIHDISPTGMLIAAGSVLSDFEELEINIPRAGSVKARVVWNSGNYFGCQFEQPITQAAISAALLRSTAREDELPTWKNLEAEPDEHEAAQNLSFRMKLRVILSTSLLLGFLILWTARLAWSTL